MEIYLMQHGPNLPRDEDPEEGLSPQGKKVVAAGAKALARMQVKPGLILASPKKRSQQTALIVSRALGYDPEAIEVSDKAEAMAPLEDTLGLLAQHQDKGSILVAGHLPSLGLVAGSLLAPCGQATVDFQRGGVCRIDVDELPSSNGRLVWYLPPRVVEALGL
jgi:phosphohistidine phosphatase